MIVLSKELQSKVKAQAEIKKLGLVSAGFGRYHAGPGEPITHKLVKDPSGEYELVELEAKTKAKTKSPVKKKASPASAPEVSEPDAFAMISDSARFQTEKDHDAWSERVFADWYKSLSADEAHALRGYKENDYEDINKQLRNGLLSKRSAKFVQHLDSAIAKSSLPEDVQVFRGFSMPKDMMSENGDYSHLIGRSLSDKAYNSVSTRPKVAKTFLNGSHDGTVMLKMTLPKGSKAASMNKGLGSDLEYTDESELLLPRGTQYVVKSVFSVKNIKNRPPAHIIHVVPILPE